MKRSLTLFTAILAYLVSTTGCAQGVAVREVAPPAADRLEAVMWAELDAWFPHCLDLENGGFRAAFDDRWQPLADPAAALVFQSRMTWVAAEVARRRPERRDEFAAYAEHGLGFLAQSMWDKEHGGFYWQVPRPGHAPSPQAELKHVYGNGFAIYAAANVYRLRGDEASLELAQNAYRWIEKHAVDPVNGGYVEALDRAGQPLKPSLDEDGRAVQDVIGTAIGYKSMNTHIHLLEAYTALYRVWPDPELRGRLESLLAIVADRIYVEPGCLNPFFTADWRAVPDHNSFGHNVETTYLLLEAAEALGPDAAARVEARAVKLSGQALAYGWDRERGGVYDAGTAFREPSDTTKVWWAQAEALNAFHLMAQHADGAEAEAYRQAFASTWQFVARHSIDPEGGGWWWSVEEDGGRVGPPGKGNDWKSAYHTVRALLEVTDRMRRADDR